MSPSKKENIMKKLLAFLAFAAILAFAFPVMSYSQGTIVDHGVIASDSLKGVSTTMTIYAPLLEDYWDYSMQLKSTFAGLGDSTNFTVTTWQTNDPDQSVWTELTAERDTLATITDVSGILIEIEDFPGMWTKHILTSLSLDTMLIEGYWVRKQKRTRFF